jgi:predicted peptidase
MPYPRTWRAILLLFTAALATIAFARKHETGFLDRTVSVNSEVYRYQVYVPQNFETQKRWPVILFLHGSGERGDDGILPTDVGIAHAIRTEPARFPFVVVIPQCRKEKLWIDPEMRAQALAALDQSVREFHGDRDRLLLTGLSMGGQATWKIAATVPHKFAAYVPICGRVSETAKAGNNANSTAAIPRIEQDPYAETAKAIGSTPVWIFHGAVDESVPVEESRKMAQALQAAKANVRYSEYPDVGHNSWDKAYAEPELVPWMLAHRLAH